MNIHNNKISLVELSMAQNIKMVQDIVYKITTTLNNIQITKLLELTLAEILINTVNTKYMININYNNTKENVFKIVKNKMFTICSYAMNLCNNISKNVKILHNITYELNYIETNIDKLLKLNIDNDCKEINIDDIKKINMDNIKKINIDNIKKINIDGECNIELINMFDIKATQINNIFFEVIQNIIFIKDELSGHNILSGIAIVNKYLINIRMDNLELEIVEKIKNTIKVLNELHSKIYNIIKNLDKIISNALISYKIQMTQTQYI